MRAVGSACERDAQCVNGLCTVGYCCDTPCAPDAGAPDGGFTDGGFGDAGPIDAGPADAGLADAALPDASVDAGLLTDAGAFDGGGPLIDAGTAPEDAGCACRAATGRGPTLPLSLGFLAAFLLATRRR